MSSFAAARPPLPGTRARILATANRLIAEGGVEALTTRAVAAAAAVQAPTLYRLFGDKEGLLDAVAEHSLAEYVAAKARREPHPDPVQDLADAWDEHVAFGLAHPAVFAIMHGAARKGPPSPAMRAGIAMLKQRVARVARAGRLRVGEERAASLVHAAGTGTILALLQVPPDERDASLARAARDAVFGAILAEDGDASPSGLATAAVTLRGHLEDAASLSPGERLLLGELLERIVETHGR